MKKITAFLIGCILISACQNNSTAIAADRVVPTIAPEIGPAEDVTVASSLSKEVLPDSTKDTLSKTVKSIKDSLKKPIEAIKEETKEAAVVVQSEAKKIAKKSDEIAQDAAVAAKKLASKAEQKVKQLKILKKK